MINLILFQLKSPILYNCGDQHQNLI